MKITFISVDRENIEVSAEVGQNLLEVIEENSLPLVAICGGAGVCASCRVKISKENANLVPPPSEHEEDILDMFQCDEGVRLACQITLDDTCDGLKVELL